ncbi:hypothetical protein [Streptomyces sp. NRRL F-2580]|uniref:hypothetical protein n=1 Tax=Streptomyces sp. NRRL F-2580 TaxID=1463841 RepID=UPI0018FED150|nr:hypothetical protein [Streptomyces sp. NRRL F-2580]
MDRSETGAVIRVMVVDDEALVRSGVTMMPNASADIEAVAATDGRRAPPTPR